MRIPKWKALSSLSSDALSSVAYATDAMLLVLVAFSASAAIWSVPIALCITGLLFVVTFSYWQIIQAYPSGGGAYTVARENLGTWAGLIAGASLLIDYTLTVSVSVSAGVENISSALPFLHDHREVACASVIFLITFINLRGRRESAGVYALPTYFFILSIFVLLGAGALKLFRGEIPDAAPLVHEVYPEVPLILVLRAFASGCAALTGVEAIANGVGIFRVPAARNAKITLIWMSSILAAMFLGITALVHVFKIVPVEGQTVMSLLGHAVFGKSGMYYFIQFWTALVLFLAASTSYTGFPRLASLLAKDRFLPRQLMNMGDRLIYSNGVIGLGLAAAALVILFKGNTNSLIPLYAIGVFLSFTLSQVGMIMHHIRQKEARKLHSLILNIVGALTTLIVLVDIASTKFLQGAWMVILTIPILVLLFSRINKHYVAVGRELSVLPLEPVASFEAIRHTVVIPVSGIHRGVLEALRYAQTISPDVRACYVELDPDATDRIKTEWTKWAPNVPFVVLKSPFRSVVEPIIKYIDDVEQTSHDDMITVVVPEFVTSKWWHRLMHNQTALFIRAALAFKRGKVVTSVRYHLKGT